MSNGIKNCPFCGSNDTFTNYRTVESGMHMTSIDIVECIGCDAQIEGENEKDAIEKWNQRSYNEGDTNDQ